MNISRYIGVLERDTPIVYTDFLIIGSGIAGLFTALKASAFGEVIVLTKKSIEDSNTGLAQGGIAAAVHEDDSPLLHLEDTLEAGAGLCNIEAVDVLVREGPRRVLELMAAGANFDMKDGSISLGREGAHSKARILHATDATGEEIRQALVKSCQGESPSKGRIKILERQFLIDIITNEAKQECLGVLVYDDEKKEKILYIAKATVIATGGAGQLYKYTTNPAVATGDGMAACFRAGCELSDLEFFQFHPTVLHSQDTQRFLISEAVRGEGGKLFNLEGKQFMSKYHPLEELAPRDVVSRAIWNEMLESGNDNVLLDMRHIPVLTKRFPNIYKNCLERGLDISTELLPVSPAAHYVMGGIKTGTNGETRLYGLYACGEAACTGVHGANRLASNSLLEGIVFGQRIVDQAEEVLYRRRVKVEEIWENYELPWVNKSLDSIEPQKAKFKLQEIMWKYVGIIRNEEGLKKANQEIEKIYSDLSPEDDLLTYYELINMLQLARNIVMAALWRKESRGGHYRSDYPEKDDLRWLKHTSFVNC